MEKLLLSIQGCRVLPFIFKKKPSELVPFKGNFPILEESEMMYLNEEIQKHRYLDECPKWVIDAVEKADRIFLIHSGFEEFLGDKGKLEGFKKLTAVEKADLFVEFTNRDCLSLESINIK